MNGIELVAGTSDIGFVTDGQGRIAAWNEAAERGLGVGAEEAIGHPCWMIFKSRDVFGNEYCGPSCPLIRMALEGRRIRRCELLIRGADGRTSPYSVITLVLRGAKPLDPAVLHFLHPARRRRNGASRERVEFSGNHQRGELTLRENEVLRLLGKGKSTAALARHLRISVATAANHVQHILYKLNVHSRLEAVAAAREIGLI